MISPLEVHMDPADKPARIWRVVATIPPGSVASYSQIAELAGLRRGARQVGRALRLAPDGLALPWHRVITAAGRIAFPMHSEAFNRQQALLNAEGVVVTNGKVAMRRYQWRVSMDERLWRLD